MAGIVVDAALNLAGVAVSEAGAPVVVDGVAGLSVGAASRLVGLAVISA